jgi:sulfite exporter TauE/SafE
VSFFRSLPVGISADRQVVAYVVFVVIATMGIGTPLLIHLAMGDRSRQLLEHLKSWMIRNSAVIMAVLSFIIGVKLIADGISRLARVI